MPSLVMAWVAHLARLSDEINCLKAPVAFRCDTVARTQAFLMTSCARTLAKADAKSAGRMKSFKRYPVSNRPTPHPTQGPKSIDGITQWREIIGPSLERKLREPDTHRHAGQASGDGIRLVWEAREIAQQSI